MKRLFRFMRAWVRVWVLNVCPVHGSKPLGNCCGCQIPRNSWSVYLMAYCLRIDRRLGGH